MKRILLFGTLLFGIISAATAQSQPWTLQQCIDSALARNLNIRQRGLDVQTARVNNQQARANQLPGFNANVSHGMNQGRSIDPFTNTYVNQKINFANYGASGDVLLFNGLSLQNNIRRTAYATNAARMDQQQERDNVTLNVILAYLQVLNNEDLVAISEAQAEVTRLQVERLEKMNEQGAISPPMLYDLRGQLKGEEVAIVNGLNALEISKLTLAQLMNLDYDSTMTVARVSLENALAPYQGTADAVYENALNRFAMVQAADLRTRSAMAAVKVARGQFYPSLFLSGNANSNYSSLAQTENFVGSSEVATDAYVLVNGGKSPVMVKQDKYNSQRIAYTDQIRNNIFTGIGVTLRVPLLNSLQTRNQVRLAKINVQTASLAEENTRLQLRQAIEQAHLNMTNAWQRYTVLQEQVEAYAESFRAAEVRFNAGAGTTVDYILAKSRLDNSNLNLVLARYDYVLRTKVLDYYNGRQ
jgi:outer membrane protein